MTAGPEIETTRLLLRLWSADDVQPAAEIEAKIGNPVTLADQASHIERYMSHWRSRGYGRWAVEEKQTGLLIGRVGVMHQPEWQEGPVKDEIGWTIDPDRWRKGYATEVAMAALADVFDRVGLPRVISYTGPHNIASRRVMEKCGFAFEGSALWRGNEVIWYALDASEWGTTA